jgi:hypothetical protein
MSSENEADHKLSSKFKNYFNSANAFLHFFIGLYVFLIRNAL